MIKKLVALLILALLAPSSALKERATGIEFAATRGDLALMGVGVRKKGPISVYAVGMYASSTLKSKLAAISRKAKDQALSILRQSVVSDDDEAATTFLLQMSFKVGAEKISAAIADSVSARYQKANEVNLLKSLIFNGVEGAATKGTTFCFDCTAAGIAVAVNGKAQGQVESPGLSKAFCNVYLDDKCVSPALIKSVVENCCGP